MTQIEARRVFGIKIRGLISDHRFDTDMILLLFSQTRHRGDCFLFRTHTTGSGQIYSQAGRHSNILEFSKHHQFRKH